jgi:hypothetical protein
MILEFSRQIFEKFSKMKFYENPSNGSASCPTYADEQMDMTKVMVAFRNFANVPNTYMTNDLTSQGHVAPFVIHNETQHDSSYFPKCLYICIQILT